MKSVYAYVRNNPVRWRDPTGNLMPVSPEELLLAELFLLSHEFAARIGLVGAAAGAGVLVGTAVNDWVEATYGQNMGGVIYDFNNRARDEQFLMPTPIPVPASVGSDWSVPIRSWPRPTDFGRQVCRPGF